MAVIIKTNGQCSYIDKKELSLQRMKEIVGGYIEHVAIIGTNLNLMVDEEGKLKNKEINMLASYLNGCRVKAIMGDVILFITGEVD